MSCLPEGGGQTPTARRGKDMSGWSEYCAVCKEQQIAAAPRVTRARDGSMVMPRANAVPSSAARRPMYSTQTGRAHNDSWSCSFAYSLCHFHLHCLSSSHNPSQTFRPYSTFLYPFLCACLFLRNATILTIELDESHPNSRPLRPEVSSSLGVSFPLPLDRSPWTS
jgi:hypothetical protein